MSLYYRSIILCLSSYFWYTCFIHISSSGHDKLSSNYVKCIFLEYSHTQKEYRCYDPLSHRSFTSASITLLESTPYYSKVRCPSAVSTDSIDLPTPSSFSPVVIVLSFAPWPLQVYSPHLRHKLRPPHTTTDPSSSNAAPTTTHDADLLISLPKGSWSCTAHPFRAYLSFWNFTVSLSSVSIPTSYHKALHHECKQRLWWDVYIALPRELGACFNFP